MWFYELAKDGDPVLEFYSDSESLVFFFSMITHLQGHY